MEQDNKHIFKKYDISNCQLYVISAKNVFKLIFYASALFLLSKIINNKI